MPKLSHLSCSAGVAALGFAMWSAVTFPIIKFSTVSILRGRLSELIDRSQLDAYEIESLDLSMQFLVSNDRQWKESHHALNRIAASGFLFCAICFFVVAAMTRRLEKRLLALSGTTD